MLQILFLIVYFSVYLHQEANETGALRLAKSKLEKQLDELTWRLHLEKKIRVLLPEKKKQCYGRVVCCEFESFYTESLSE